MTGWDAIGLVLLLLGLVAILPIIAIAAIIGILFYPVWMYLAVPIILVFLGIAMIATL